MKDEDKITIRVDADFLNEIDQNAANEKQTRSAWIKEAIRSYLDKSEKKEPDYISLNMEELNEQIEKLEAIKVIYKLKDEIATLKASIQAKKTKVNSIQQKIDDAMYTNTNQMQKS